MRMGLELFFLVICSLLMSAETPSHTHGQNGKEEKEEKRLCEALGVCNSC
jgi:hypothetical protein